MIWKEEAALPAFTLTGELSDHSMQRRREIPSLNTVNLCHIRWAQSSGQVLNSMTQMQQHSPMTNSCNLKVSSVQAGWGEGAVSRNLRGV